MTYREIGEKLGVTKQYLSFVCNRKKNNPEIVNRKLLLEFDKEKDAYELHQQIRIKRRLFKKTQKEIAQNVGTFASVVTRIETGDLKHSIFIVFILNPPLPSGYLTFISLIFLATSTS